MFQAKLLLRVRCPSCNEPGETDATRLASRMERRCRRCGHRYLIALSIDPNARVVMETTIRQLDLMSRRYIHLDVLPDR